MGKDLRGKELGVGITWLFDGLYAIRTAGARQSVSRSCRNADSGCYTERYERSIYVYIAEEEKQEEIDLVAEILNVG